jgi:ribonucleoside-triphosphate reductase
MKKCDAKVEVWSRVVGFFRPVQHFNKGAKSQYKDRRTYKVTESMGSE